MKTATVLVADIDTNICDFLTFFLGKENFQVKTVSNELELNNFLEKSKPELLMLSDSIFTEMSECDKNIIINLKNSFPIILMQSGDTDSVEFNYLKKPFDISELMKTVKTAISKTNDLSDFTDKIVYDNFCLDINNKDLFLNNNHIHLTDKQFDLLFCIVSNPERIFSREQVLDEVFGMKDAQDLGYIDDCIKELRTMLDGVSEKWSLKIVWGIGYKFELND